MIQYMSQKQGHQTYRQDCNCMSLIILVKPILMFIMFNIEFLWFHFPACD